MYPQSFILFNNPFSRFGDSILGSHDITSILGFINLFTGYNVYDSEMIEFYNGITTHTTMTYFFTGVPCRKTDFVARTKARTRIFHCGRYTSSKIFY